MEEIRSQVDRGWTHTQFFILLNAGIAGAVLAFFAEGASSLLAALILLGGVAVGTAGIFVLRENKRYYRTLAIKRAALEKTLGLLKPIPGTSHPLLVFAISPTKDVNALNRMLDDPENYIRRNLRKGSVSGWAQWTLLALVIFDFVGALALLVGAIQ